LEPEPLRTHLRERLPDYMIPSAFVILTALPLTTEREAGPGGPAGAGAGGRGFLAGTARPDAGAAGQPVGRRPGLGPGGVHDNFFELGGHSLLATRLISRVRVAFQVEVSLRSPLRRPDHRRSGGGDRGGAGRAGAAGARDRAGSAATASCRSPSPSSASGSSISSSPAAPTTTSRCRYGSKVSLDLGLLGRTLSEFCAPSRGAPHSFPDGGGTGRAGDRSSPCRCGRRRSTSARCPRRSGAPRLCVWPARRQNAPSTSAVTACLRLTLLRLDRGAADHAALFTLHQHHLGRLVRPECWCGR